MAQVIQYPPQDEPIAVFNKPDDDQIATDLAPQYQGRYAFFYSAWREYQGGVWTVRDENEMRRIMRKDLRYYRQFGTRVTNGLIKSILQILQDDLYVPERVLDKATIEQERYINLLNGLYNLETFGLEPHRSDLYFTSQLDFAYDPEDWNYDNFQRYLNTSLVHPETLEPDRNLHELLLMALGYSFTSRTDLQASFWLVGEKASGKSTLLSMLANIMGDLHITVDLNRLGTDDYLLGNLLGKRVVTFPEANENRVIDDAQYKTLVGGTDRIYANVKYKQPFSYHFKGKVWWGMNATPRFTDMSGAVTRRIVIIPFNRTIPEHDRVRNLDQLLLKERSAIFNLAMSRYARLVNGKKWHVSQQSQQRLQEYIFDNDIAASFVDECCITQEGCCINSSELYDAYRTWCDRFGFKPKQIKQLAKDWRRLGFRDRKSNGHTIWDGLQLRPF